MVFASEWRGEGVGGLEGGIFLVWCVGDGEKKRVRGVLSLILALLPRTPALRASLLLPVSL